MHTLPMQPSAADPATRQAAVAPRAVRHGAAVVLVFTAAFAWLYGRAWTTGNYLAESDLYEYFLPIFLAKFRTWSAFEFGGIPVFTDPGESFAYPVFVLFAKLIGSWTAYAVSAHVLAACGTYAYVYAVTRTRAAAFVAALAFGLSEATIERLAHMSTLHTIGWMPFVFVCVERLLATGSSRWAALGALSTTCVILAGHPQPALYACIAAAAYALAGGIAERKDRRYFVLAGAVFALAGMIAAVKLLPFMQVMQHMARDTVSFGHFIARGNNGAQLWTVLFPTVMHDGREAPTYVGLIPLLLVAVAATYWRREWRVVFWVVAVIVATMFGIGEHSPIARFAFDYLPAYNKFRVGARHLIVAGFGAVVLAGFGVAFIMAERAVGRALAAAAALVGIVAAGLIALSASNGSVPFEVRQPIPWSTFGLPSVVADALWTQGFIALVSAGCLIGFARSRGAAPWLAAAIVVIVADLLNAQPFAVTPAGIQSAMMPRAAAQPSVHAEAIRSAMAPLHQRALALGGTARDSVIPAAWARVWQVPIAGGYGPMLLRRHSELATMGRDGAVRPRVLAQSDQALNLLAVKTLLVQAQDVASRGTIDIGGIAWDVEPLDLPVGRADCGYAHARTVTVPLPRDVEITAVHVLAHLRCAEHVPQGERVGSISVVGNDGSRVTQVLRAGIEVSDASVIDPAVRGRAGHGPAGLVPDAAAPGGQQSLVSVGLPQPIRAARLEVDAAGTGGWLVVARVTAADAAGFITRPPARTFLDDAERWQVLARFRTARFTDRGRNRDVDGEQAYVVYENRDALPRAWLVGRVEKLRLIDVPPSIRDGQLPDGRRFDPREAVLMAEEDASPPRVDAAVDDAQVRVATVEDGRLVAGVSSSKGGFLVVSETYFPGWRATLDGVPTTVYRADLSLQGVVVPPGTHRVVFTFVPVTLYAGAAISLAALAGVAMLLRPRLAPNR